MVRSALVCSLMGLVVSLAACTMWEKPASGWSGATGGEQLERQFWKDISKQNWSELQKHLAPNFTAVTPGGKLDRNGSLTYWRSLQLTEYALGEFAVRQNGADFVVTYTLTRPTGSANSSASALHMMSVWQEVSDRWLMIAHSASVTGP